MNSGAFFRVRLAGLATAFVVLGFVSQNVTAGVTTDGTDSTDGKDGKTQVAGTEEEPEYKNWIELGIGGVIVDGDQAQFEQQHHLPGNTAYGGIEDAHYEKSLGSDFQLTVDGHALWDINDYDVKIELSKAKVGYLRAGFTEFRSWYDGDGGFFPPNEGAPNGTFFSPPIPEMYVDRGEAWAELGLLIPDWPQIVIHYSHIFRDGEKDSTEWGDTTLTGLPATIIVNGKTVALNQTRKIAPAWRGIDENRDIIDLDITKNFDQTDVGIGMIYEHDSIDNTLNLERGAGQLAVLTPGPPPTITGAQRFITQRDVEDTDIFNGHAMTETRFTDNFWFTAAYSYSTLGNDLGGTRIIGDTYNSMLGNIPTLQSNDHGVLDLAGTSETQEHVVNANLFYIPFTDLNVIAGFRYTREDTNANSTYLDTNTAANVAPFTLTNPKGGFHLVTPIPHLQDSDNTLNNFSGRVELRYTHIKDWLFYAEGEWEDEYGTVHEHEISGTLTGGVAGVGATVVPSDLGDMNKNNYLLSQKYTAGATWYPMTRLNFAGQYYFQSASYDNDFLTEFLTPPTPAAERNQRLIGQDWGTNDFNIRMTARPKVPDFLGTISFVSRYDFMLTSIEGKWAISPTGVGSAPTNTYLNEEHTGTISQHVISEAVNWNPTARLYLTANAAITLQQTKTPADKTDLVKYMTPTPPAPSVPVFYPSPSILISRNDFWSVDAGAGYLIDDKTDVRADYSYYKATDYTNNSNVGMPYGMGDSEHIASVTLTRQITKNMRLLVKYSYYNYDDPTSGGFNNYTAHSIYSGLQIRF